MKCHIHNFPAEKIYATQKRQSIREIKPRDLLLDIHLVQSHNMGQPSFTLKIRTVKIANSRILIIRFAYGRMEGKTV
jgi:hypothetical protein